MFFIGIFGIQPGKKEVGEGQGICPSCEAFDRYVVDEVYTYLHFFFIPIWKWNRRYFVRTRCCRRTLELEGDVGRRIASGERIQLRPEHIVRAQPGAQGEACPNCGSVLRPDYRFCPRCGSQL
ncbi:MAG TPA: zinc ribbon domain-containing protein [Firmicutes bacterium]|nr:MAG: hypothetical protein AA931_04675 [Peptococcaceae bacterium 1109]HHT73060.1 zinc ribbon domain-containing protein [Bacillota bacterium]